MSPQNAEVIGKLANTARFARRTDNRERWREYIATCPSYGTMEDRRAEYDLAMQVMEHRGVTERDLVVDVGCGDQGLDWFLRTQAGWRGQYVGVDGSIDGTELDEWEPSAPAEFFVCLEVVEHLHDPERLLTAMRDASIRSCIVTTPNPAVVDVLAVDPTHVTPVSIETLRMLGFQVTGYEINGRGAWDTLLAWT